MNRRLQQKFTDEKASVSAGSILHDDVVRENANPLDFGHHTVAVFEEIRRIAEDTDAAQRSRGDHIVEVQDRTVLDVTADVVADGFVADVGQGWRSIRASEFIAVSRSPARTLSPFPGRK